MFNDNKSKGVALVEAMQARGCAELMKAHMNDEFRGTMMNAQNSWLEDMNFQTKTREMHITEMGREVS